MNHKINPFQRKERVEIPVGTPYRYRGDKGRTKRLQVIEVHMTFDGYDGFPMSVTAPGSGGYWKDYEVTPQLLSVNGKS